MRNPYGVIFDLDGVIVSTDEYHYQAWKQLSDSEGLVFNRKINEQLRGVSRAESLEIILSGSSKVYSPEKKENMATRKNEIYKGLLQELSSEDILPGVINLLNDLKANGFLTAIGSSSKNAPVILQKICLEDAFDQVVDGNDIKNSKPDPEVFLLAAHNLELRPSDCIVVEDAEAGVLSALAAGMKVVGVGFAADSPNVHAGADNLLKVTANTITQLMEETNND